MPEDRKYLSTGVCRERDNLRSSIFQQRDKCQADLIITSEWNVYDTILGTEMANLTLPESYVSSTVSYLERFFEELMGRRGAMNIQYQALKPHRIILTVPKQTLDMARSRVEERYHQERGR